MRISRRVLGLVADHAQQSAPRECCGILLCTGDVSSTVNRVIPAENVEQENPEREYELDHRTHLKAVEMEIAGDAHIAGYYHSHPASGAKPSRRDVEKAIIGVTYLIIGMVDGRMEHTAWQLEEGDLIPEPLEIGE